MAKDAEPIVEKLSFGEIKRLITELGFSEIKQQGLLSQIDVLVESSREHPFNTRSLALLVFYKAYLERFSSIPKLTNP